MKRNHDPSPLTPTSIALTLLTLPDLDTNILSLASYPEKITLEIIL